MGSFLGEFCEAVGKTEMWRLWFHGPGLGPSERLPQLVRSVFSYFIRGMGPTVTILATRPPITLKLGSDVPALQKSSWKLWDMKRFAQGPLIGVLLGRPRGWNQEEAPGARLYTWIGKWSTETVFLVAVEKSQAIWTLGAGIWCVWKQIKVNSEPGRRWFRTKELAC